VRLTEDGQVERQIEDGVQLLEPRPCDLLSGQRRRGKEQLEARIPLAELADQRARRQSLAHRHRVNPNRLVAVKIKADGQTPHPL
jgi:hypothetical protein